MFEWCCDKEHLACFLPATLALGVIHGLDKSHLTLAANLTKTCYEMYHQTATGLSGDIVAMNIDPHEGKDFYVRVISATFKNYFYSVALSCLLTAFLYFVFH